MAELRYLLEKLEYEVVQGSLDIQITEVVYDSRKVTEGCLFICIEGANFDGHTFAAQVAEKAGVLIVSKDVEGIPETVTVIKVKDTRYAKISPPQ